MSNRVPARDPTRPADDAGIGDPSLVHLTLPPAKRRVAGHRPAPRVVVVGGLRAELADAAPQLASRRGRAVPQPGVVDGAVRPALRTGAVVGDQHDERVVALAELLDE